MAAGEFSLFASRILWGTMFDKILIANRGEIALRILRACKELGINTVAVHSTADADAMHVRLADESGCIGPPPAKDSYLNVPAVISAAETVLHGGPATLLAAADAETQRRASAESLLETGGSEGWRLATLVERTLATRVPLFGVSLVLNHPQFTGLLHGYPYELEAADRIARSPLRLRTAAEDVRSPASSSRAPAPTMPSSETA